MRLARVVIATLVDSSMRVEFSIRWKRSGSRSMAAVGSLWCSMRFVVLRCWGHRAVIAGLMSFGPMVDTRKGIRFLSMDMHMLPGGGRILCRYSHQSRPVFFVALQSSSMRNPVDAIESSDIPRVLHTHMVPQGWQFLPWCSSILWSRVTEPTGRINWYSPAG
jgi:murein endopeptidase